jgi:hypothetical protein
MEIWAGQEEEQDDYHNHQYLLNAYYLPEGKLRLWKTNNSLSQHYELRTVIIALDRWEVCS